MFGFHNDIDASADGVAVTDNTLWQSDIALQHGKINCGASSRPNFIQNYFFWKWMFCKHNFHKKRYYGYTKTNFSPLSSILGPSWSISNPF